ncbi:MAG: polysaccharide deacetylase family protein [Candidatus Hydrogenedentes bacterium]|nr:polysaccharide deacetylase family protein [Candidatus Hydrogenedentota bacterium]
MRRIHFWGLVASLGLIWGECVAAGEQTYAERLGWKATDRVVIFHCDDAGMSHASNVGAWESIQKGVVTSVSIMMPCPWVPEFAAWLKQNPQVDAGLHLTMNAEWERYRWLPVAGKPAVPSLVDAQGCLWDNVAQVVEHATPDDVEREIRAQIERAEQMGIPITHIDSHMGTLFAKREFFDRYMKVAIEKQIPMLAVGGHLHYGRVENPDAVGLLKDIAKQIWDAGLPVIDDVHTASYDWGNVKKSKKFIEVLTTLQPGITEIIVHCSKPDDSFPLITSSSEARHQDTLALIDRKVRAAIEKEGIILTTWRELKQRRDRAGRQ